MKGKFATSFSRLHVTRSKLFPARKEKNTAQRLTLEGGGERNTKNEPPHLLLIAFSPPLLFPPNRLALFVKASLVRAFFSPFVFLQPRVLAVTHHAFSFFFLRPVPKDLLPSPSRPLAIKSRKKLSSEEDPLLQATAKTFLLLLFSSRKVRRLISTSPPPTGPPLCRRRRRRRGPTPRTAAAAAAAAACDTL